MEEKWEKTPPKNLPRLLAENKNQLEAVNFTRLLFAEEPKAQLYVNRILLFYLLSFTRPQS